MKVFFRFLPVLLMPVFIACGGVADTVPALELPTANVLTETKEPFAEVNNTRYSLELATTPRTRQLGLMYRESLPKNHGMLFVFDTPQVAKFWMKNTLISLDIVWLSETGEILDVITMDPCVTPTCPSDGPDLPAKYVLEVAGGTFVGRVGDTMQLELSE